jgi:SAM-dependent methyltransferase
VAIGHDKAQQPLGGSVHPERFDPDRHSDTLMDSEHRGRYWWAAQFAPGRSTLDAGCGTGYGLEILAQAGAAELTGVDIDDGAVATAQERAEGSGAAIVRGDLQSLDFPDDSFDLAVCFETIEHLAAPQQGIAELARVVRPGGTLIVSSPNPDVYPSGNEHHLHELRPDELSQLVDSRFPTARVYFQHAWLASVIEPEDGHASGDGDRSEQGARVRRSSAAGSGASTFTIVVGCEADEREPAPLVNLGDPFEVKWWEERVAEAGARAEATITEATDSIEASAREAVAKAEQEVARLEAVLARQEADAARNLQEVGAALVDANQELAQLPLLKHRLAEMYERKDSLQARLDTVLGSRSWQITGFLRRLSAMLKLQR